MPAPFTLLHMWCLRYATRHTKRRRTLSLMDAPPRATYRGTRSLRGASIPRQLCATPIRCCNTTQDTRPELVHDCGSVSTSVASFSGAIGYRSAAVQRTNEPQQSRRSPTGASQTQSDRRAAREQKLMRKKSRLECVAAHAARDGKWTQLMCEIEEHTSSQC
jgi:hypothetical protein